MKIDIAGIRKLLELINEAYPPQPLHMNRIVIFDGKLVIQIFPGGRGSIQMYPVDGEHSPEAIFASVEKAMSMAEDQ
jgi:hypothetical protein